VGKVPGLLSVSEYVDRCRKSSLEAMQKAETTQNGDLRKWFFDIAMGWHAIAVELEQSFRGSDEWSPPVANIH